MKHYVIASIAGLCLLVMLPMAIAAEEAVPSESLLAEQEPGTVVTFADEPWILLEPEEGLMIRQEAEYHAWHDGNRPNFYWDGATLSQTRLPMIKEALPDLERSWVERREFPEDDPGNATIAYAHDAYVSILTISQAWQYEDLIIDQLDYHEERFTNMWVRNDRPERTYLSLDDFADITYTLNTTERRAVFPMLHVQNNLYVDQDMTVVEPFTDTTAPEVTVDPDGSGWTDDIHVNVEVQDDLSGVDDDSLQYAWHSSKDLPADEAFSSFDTSESLSLPEDADSGEYSLHITAADYWGNETSFVSEPYLYDGTAEGSPFLSLEEDGNGTVTVDVDGYGLDIEDLRFVKGSKETGDFSSEDTGEPIINGSFTAQENGDYTVYARDIAGNESVATINVEQIIEDDPELSSLILYRNGEPVELDQAFSPDVTTYHAPVPVPKRHANLTLEAVTEAANATVTVNGDILESDDQLSVDFDTGTYTIVVKIDGATETLEETYTLTVARAASPPAPRPVQPEQSNRPDHAGPPDHANRGNQNGRP